MTVTNLSTYVLAQNYGAGGSGPCFTVRARAQDDTGGALIFRYGPVDAAYSKVESIGYPLVFRQTNATPYPNVWASWSGVNFYRTATVTT